MCGNPEHNNLTDVRGHGQGSQKRWTIIPLLGKHCLRELRKKTGGSPSTLVQANVEETPLYIRCWEQSGRALAKGWPYVKMVVREKGCSLTGPMHVKLQVKLDTP